jgi:hypothetical protein
MSSFNFHVKTELERHKSARSKRPVQSEESPAQTSDGEVSSGTRSTSHSRRSSAKKIKRANKAELVQVIPSVNILPELFIFSVSKDELINNLNVPVITFL